jgi:hypothetical protein
MKRICIVDWIEACFYTGRADEWALMKQHWMKTFLLTAALLGTPSVAKADLVTDWNTIAISTVAGDVNQRQSRAMAMVHAAMFDAMNGIRAEYTPAMVSVHGKGYASREAAGAQAAHDVLVALFPAQQVALDANLAATLLQIPADPPHGKQPTAEGIAVGQAAAAAVLALRAHDHAFDVVPFVAPPPDPGNYRFTGECTAATMSVPGFGNVTPFTLADPDAFPLPDRPALDDPEWYASLIETRDYGSANSLVRTPTQTEIALFYIEGAVTGVNRLARTLIAKESVQPQRHAAAEQLLAHARLFAALNIAQADTQIRTWRSKYRNLFWRPETAIRAMFPAMFLTWTPLRPTPCHPEFFAGHGTVTPAGITALQNYFGDAVNVDVTSTSSGVTRHYNSLEQIIQDVNGARIWAGFHYRSTMVRSNVLGRAVANWVNLNLMQPLDHYDDEGEDNDGH